MNGKDFVVRWKSYGGVGVELVDDVSGRGEEK